MAAPAAMVGPAPLLHNSGMTKPFPTSTARCSAIAMVDGDTAPDWIHLVPAGEVRTHDGRGPYRIADAAALMAASLKAGDKLVLDENHSTDIAAPRGDAAPARGWIVELQHRADGIWGRVEWTEAGRAKVAAKEYRGISPVIGHRADGTVTQILRASIVNQPNLLGLTALHQEQNMDFRAKLIEALGLGSDADDAAIMAGIKAKMDAKPDAEATAAALQSALLPIAQLVGLDDKADATAILAGVQTLKAGSGDVTALQSQIVGLTGQVKSLQDDAKKATATAFVDAEMAKGRVGINQSSKGEYIAMHMENPERAAKLVNAMPIVAGGAQLTVQPGNAAAGSSEDPVQIAAHATVYQKKQAEAGMTIDYAAAVSAVMEGRHK